MAREEQIENFANSQVDCEFFNENTYNGILISAKWADENPKEGLVSIDKACEYLESKLKSRIGYYSAYNFTNDFRKAMEE